MSSWDGPWDGVNETWEQYVQRIGAPSDVECEVTFVHFIGPLPIDLLPPNLQCKPHGYIYRGDAGDFARNECPMFRRERYRAATWRATELDFNSASYDGRGYTPVEVRHG